MHWPGNFGSTDKATNRAQRKAVWEVLEEVYELGVARAVGVSNWSEVHLQELADDGAKLVPHVNQIEVSPHCQYSGLMDYCKAKGITLTAYSPLGSHAGTVLKNPTAMEMSAKYEKNPGQLVLRWLVQQGIVVLPRPSSEARIASNSDVFDFAIDKADMAALTALNKGKSETNASPYDFP